MEKSNLNHHWAKHSIESAPARGLTKYEAITGINRENLRGKTILDLGAGRDNLFANELKSKGIDCNIVSLSPDFSIPEHQPSFNKQNSLAGIAEELPFKENTFDYILDVGGPGIHAHKTEQVERWAKEVIRVLKKGGTFVSALSKLDMITLMRVNKKIIAAGHKASFENFSDPQLNQFLREVITKSTEQI